MTISKKFFQGIFKSLGPGILFACVTVGGSHFVQSTHAGAEYGLHLIPVLILIYILKYPFFEFAQRYATATKKTLLEGYLSIGRWALILYFILVGCTAFPTIAALSLVDANLTAYFLNTTISPIVLSIGILALCTFILLLGNYPWLDRTIKVIMLILILSSLITFFIALPEGIHTLQTPSPKISYLAELPLLMILMAGMPAPIDVSVWTTLWSKARSRQTKYSPTLKEGLIDFNIGYAISIILAIIFVSLGAFVMFASSQSFSKSGVIFIEQLITLFTTHIGKWGEPFIAIIIFSVLSSATLTSLDAYPRALTNALTLIAPKTKQHTILIYWMSVLLLFFISILLSGRFTKSMKELVDIATIMAFLTAPVFGFLNYRVATKALPKEASPPRALLLLSKIGLLFLISVSAVFILLMIL